MAYYYYKQNVQGGESCTLPNGITIKKRIPRPYVSDMTKLNIGYRRFFSFVVKVLLQNIINVLLCKKDKGLFIEYDLIKNGIIISKAVLISKISLYEFLPKNGIHLGFCETLYRERGKGFYPLLLKYIQNDNPSLHLYMIVDCNNMASIKGIEKAGFVRYAKGTKNNKGHFVITDVLPV